MGKAELEGLILAFLGASGPQDLCDIRSYCQRNSKHLVTRMAVARTLEALTASGQLKQLLSPTENTHWSINHA